MYFCDLGRGPYFWRVEEFTTIIGKKKKDCRQEIHSGQDMIRHTNIIPTGNKRENMAGYKKQNMTQSKPGNTQKTQKKKKNPMQKGDVPCLLWLLENVRVQLTLWYWPLRSHSNCPSAVGGFSLSSGNVKVEFTEHEVRIRQQHSIMT